MLTGLALVMGLRKALTRRPVSENAAEIAGDGIEAELRAEGMTVFLNSHLLSEVIEDRGTFYADNVRTSEYGYGDTMRQIVKAINGTSIPMADVIDDDTYR